MTTRDTEIVQAAGNLHHHIRHAFLGQAQDISDNPTPLDPSDHVFDDTAHPSNEAVEPLLRDAQLVASGLFFGCRVSTPGGSSP